VTRHRVTTLQMLWPQVHTLTERVGEAGSGG